MRARGRKVLLWAIVGTVVLSGIALVLIYQRLSPQEAIVSWRYKITGRGLYGLRMYTRPQGGCFVTERNKLHILDSIGLEVCPSIILPARLYSRAIVDEDGNIYFGVIGGRIITYSSEGKLRWSCTLPDLSHKQQSLRLAKIAFGSAGRIIVVIDTGEIAILTCDGKVERRIDAGRALGWCDQPVSAPAGGFYITVSNSDSKMYGADEIRHISATGVVLWKLEVPAGVLGIKSWLHGKVLTYSSGFTFHVVSSDGTEIATYQNALYGNSRTGHSSFLNNWYSAQVDEFGNVIIASEASLIAFDFRGHQLWSRQVPGIMNISVVNDDNVFVQTYVGVTERRIRELLQRRSNKYNMNLRIQKRYYPYRLDIYDKSTGLIKLKYDVGENTKVLCGPSPRGKYYGYCRTNDKVSNMTTIEILCFMFD